MKIIPCGYYQKDFTDFITVKSPLNKKVIGEIPALNFKQIDTIYTQSFSAFQKYKNTNFFERIDYLLQIKTVLLNNKEELAKSLAWEVAKNIDEAKAEVVRSAEYIDMVISFAKTRQPQTYDGNYLNKNNICGIFVNQPLGVTLAISPFNYPINLSISKIIPALITGNTVVWKPPTQGSFVSIKLFNLIIKHTALPLHVLQIVTGLGKIISKPLVGNDHVKLINFTGSTGAGKIVAEYAKMSKLIFELGGNDPAVILSDANVDLAVKNVVSGALSYNGQRCTAIKRIYVHTSLHSIFVKKLHAAIKNLPIGCALNSKITPLISQSAYQYAINLMNNPKNKGKLVTSFSASANNLLSPQIIDGCDYNDPIILEEQFAPILPICCFDNIDKELPKINKSKYGLQASIFTNSLEKFMAIANKIEAGSVHLNSQPKRSPDYFPFLGIKMSGIGVQGIDKLLSEYVVPKGIILHY